MPISTFERGFQYSSKETNNRTKQFISFQADPFQRGKHLETHGMSEDENIESNVTDTRGRKK